MKKLLSGFVLCCFVLSSAAVAFSAEKRGTPAEAEAMVKKAVKYIKANGKDKALAEFSNPKGKFTERDLYITVYDMNGNCLAHGFNQKMVGKNMLELKDPDGRAFIKDRIEQSKSKDKFWMDFKFVNPLSKQIEQKKMYTEKMGGLLVSCGAYQ